MKIYTALQSNYNENERYPGTYLHGNLEKRKGYDVFSFAEPTDFEEGIHLVDIEGTKCFFILWEGGFYGYRGYLIEADDYESVSYCLENYCNKKDLI